MKPERCIFAVVRTADRETLANRGGPSAEQFSRAAGSIEAIARKLNVPHNGIVFTHIRHEKGPQLTAERLAQLLDGSGLRAWSYWGTLTQFGNGLAAIARQQQLPVIVCRQERLEEMLWMAEADDARSEQPRLVPFIFRLTITRGLLRKPVYRLKLITS